MVSKIGNVQHIKMSTDVDINYTKDDFCMMVSKKLKDERKKNDKGDFIGVAMSHPQHFATLNKPEGGFSKKEKTSLTKDKLAINNEKIHQKGIVNTLAKPEAKEVHKLSNRSNTVQQNTNDNSGSIRNDSVKTIQDVNGLGLNLSKNTNDNSGSDHNDALKKTHEELGLGSTAYAPDAQHFLSKSENAKNATLNTSLSNNKQMVPPAVNHVAQNVKYDDKFNINYNFNTWEGKPSANVRVPDSASLDPRIIVSTSDLGTKAILSQHSQWFGGNSTLFIDQPNDGEDKRSQNYFQDEERDE